MLLLPVLLALIGPPSHHGDKDDNSHVSSWDGKKEMDKMDVFDGKGDELPTTLRDIDLCSKEDNNSDNVSYLCVHLCVCVYTSKSSEIRTPPYTGQLTVVPWCFYYMCVCACVWGGWGGVGGWAYTCVCVFLHVCMFVYMWAICALGVCMGCVHWVCA